MAKLSDHVKDAARDLADLNTLYCVIGMLENGTISSNHSRDVSRIIAICKSGAQKALARYDRHVAAINAGWEQ